MRGFPCARRRRGFRDGRGELGRGDLETIREKTQALNAAAQPLAQALYADQQASSAPAGAAAT